MKRDFGPSRALALSQVGVFTASLLLALFCKRRAGRAFADRERDTYLRWHTAWHLVLPGGAIAGMLLLD